MKANLQLAFSGSADTVLEGEGFGGGFYMDSEAKTRVLVSLCWVSLMFGFLQKLNYYLVSNSILWMLYCANWAASISFVSGS